MEIRAGFGLRATGEAVEAVTIRAGRIAARLLTLGAILQDLRIADVPHGMTPGSARLADYEGPLRYFGAIVGPVANRIGGARAVIDGATWQMEPNENGRTALHSGGDGVHARVWRIEALADDAVTLALDLPDGACGLPGNRRLAARFSVHAPAVLRLVLTATTDTATLMNPAQHSYWNLDGSPGWQGHSLRIAAERWLPVGADGIPRGAALPVGETPHDFRAGKRPVPGVPPLDHNFCLSDAPAPLREVAWLTGASGIEMALATTAPGLQVYDGRHAAYQGIALEPQHWPDAPNHPAFPPILLRPGEPWEQVTEWRFALPG